MNNPEHTSPEDLELIDRYLLRSMSKEELAAFNSRLTSDAPFSAAFHELKLIYDGINEAALQDRMNAYHSAMQTKKAGRAISIPLRKWIAAAAAVLLVAAGIGWFAMNNKDAQLYARYYTQDPGLISAMGSSPDNYDFDKAMVDYKTGNYNAAIDIWQKQLTAKPDNDTLNYFLGAAWLGKKEAAKSMGYLRKVAALGSSYFYSDAQWYLGLASLRLGNREEAIRAISRSDHPGKDDILARIKDK